MRTDTPTTDYSDASRTDGNDVIVATLHWTIKKKNILDHRKLVNVYRSRDRVTGDFRLGIKYHCCEVSRKVHHYTTVMTAHSTNNIMHTLFSYVLAFKATQWQCIKY